MNHNLIHAAVYRILIKEQVQNCTIEKTFDDGCVLKRDYKTRSIILLYCFLTLEIHQIILLQAEDHREMIELTAQTKTTGKTQATAVATSLPLAPITECSEWYSSCARRND